MSNSWLRKAFGFGRSVFGKIKNALSSGIRLYNRGRDMYSEYKQKLSDMPVIGPAATAMVSRAEDKAEGMMRSKLGIGMGDINRGVRAVERGLQYMPG